MYNYIYLLCTHLYNCYILANSQKKENKNLKIILHLTKNINLIYLKITVHRLTTDVKKALK